MIVAAAALLPGSGAALAAPRSAAVVEPAAFPRAGTSLRWTARTSTAAEGAPRGEFRLYGGAGAPELLLLGEFPARPDLATYRQTLSGRLAGINLFQLRFVDANGREYVLATLLRPEPAIDDQPASGVPWSPGHNAVAAAGQALAALPVERSAGIDLRGAPDWRPDPPKPPPEAGRG